MLLENPSCTLFVWHCACGYLVSLFERAIASGLALAGLVRYAMVLLSGYSAPFIFYIVTLRHAFSVHFEDTV